MIETKKNKIKRNNILDNCIVIIKMLSDKHLSKQERLGKNVTKVLDRYPVIITLVMEASRIICIKPQLCRMGKGKGKVIGVASAFNRDDTLLYAFVPKDKMFHLTKIMDKQGLFDTSSLYVLVYYI